MTKSMKKMVSLILVLCLCFSLAAPAMAATWNSRSSTNNSNSLLGGCIGQTTETEKSEESNDEGMMLSLVEDQSTVSEDVTMRAAVYEADKRDIVARAELQGSTVVYYPSTFFDYDKDAINQSMANLEVQYAVDNGLSTSSNGWKWKGLYFGEGGSTSGKNNREVSRTGSGVSGEVTYTQASNVRYRDLAGSDVANAETNYYYYNAASDEYYTVYVTRETSDGGCNGRDGYKYTLTANGEWSWEGTTDNTANNVSGVTLYTRTVATTSVTSSTYEPWVKWGQDDTAVNGGYIHSDMTTGLVDGVPQFVAPYASRLFDDSVVNGKTRYTNVGLPFILDKDGYYTFDSSFNGAYFPDGEAKSDVNLTLQDAPVVLQGYRDLGNGYTKLWSTCFMPFNKPASANKQNTSIVQTDGTQLSNDAYRLQAMSGTSSPTSYNYFFSMVTPVPFTMTENGRINPSDDGSAPIVFEFSGDDDVWVFIDDVLVLDLGGIHDAVSGKIDFAANEVTFETCASGMTDGDATTDGYGVNTDTTDNITISQDAIFNDGETVGKLNTTRSTFAATDNHTLTVVYVERGANLSNNKIRFNLPQKDYVAVTKQIDKNLYQNTDETTVVGQITNELFATLNARNFTYILYENDVAMTGVRFSRYDANGNFMGNGTTASDGRFYVKNGETVRFYDVTFDGEHSYRVDELDPDYGSNNNAWGAAAWAHAIRTAYADDSTVEAINSFDNYYGSNRITTKGSEEAVDVIYFTNTNKLLSPVADIANDEYVIDYGLKVELNPLANDTYSATTDGLTLTGISDAVDGTFANSVTGKYGTLELSGNKVVYTLDKQFTGVETFYYQVGLTSGADDMEGTFGTITIMPATSMYYEEDFGFVNYTGNWTPVGTAEEDPQEEGRVGNDKDSPYGSDAAYLNDIHDSNGTSMYVNTTDASASFNYTFTGTGTTIFARTTNNSGYIIVSITDEDGNGVTYHMRDTSYKTKIDELTMYNIPVYTWEGDYGTYNVSVTVSKYFAYNGTTLYGGEFWLDGIRIIDPLGTTDETTPDSTDVATARAAYSADGEANMSAITLRNKLINDYTDIDEETGDIFWTNEASGFVVFTDTNGEIVKAAEYQANGPKEEVYLDAGQSITFSLYDWDANTNKLYLGLKAPKGAGTVVINNNTVNINNATDCYYEIGRYASITEDADGVKIATFTITAGVDSLISVTNIKVTGNFEFVIIKQEDIEIENPEGED